MRDIVELWKDELESLGGTPMTTAEHYANDLAGIVKTLRQRVLALEAEAERAGAVVLNINAEKLRLEKELATLKAGQGEPQWQHVAATTLARFVNHGTPFEGDEKWAAIADVAIKLLNQPYAAAPKPEDK